ncbi:hypothetical protein BVY03_03435 [bacterium K02(2017)]|nr:hypothetical protein BVY03_03435 [bacterium K02(2017)]
MYFLFQIKRKEKQHIVKLKGDETVYIASSTENKDGYKLVDPQNQATMNKNLTNQNLMLFIHVTAS